MILPQYAIVNQEHGPLTGKAYILVPEYRTGDVLSKAYHEGRIVSDSPTVMYYSGLSPSFFISSRQLAWYEVDPDSAKLAAWLRLNNVSYVVWEKSTSSELWHIFPNFDDGQIHKLGLTLFIPVYEDTIIKRHEIQQQNGTALWEHDFPGTPELVIYQVQFISVL